jgi:CelD/BcsL family acetyltransferase involved in cellulose biosynthesis
MWLDPLAVWPRRDQPIVSAAEELREHHDLVVRIEPVPAADELEPLWCRLEERAAAHFFLTWPWISSWLRTCDCTVYLVRVSTGGRCVGLALLGAAADVRHRGLLRVPTLHLNASGDEDRDVVTIEYNDILADRDHAPAVRRAWLDHLLRLRRLHDGRRFDALAWRGALAPDAAAALEGIAWPWRIVAEAPSAFVDLAAIRTSGRPYLDHVSSNTRRQVRRSMALYEERYGALRLDAAADVGEALAFFHAAGALHQARWQPRGKPGAFAYLFYVRFHERLITDGLPDGVVELVRVSAGEVPIGYLYNFLYRGRVYYYFSGLRYEADNRLKPGLVSHTLCIERHLARGMDVYDFMAGDNRYKTSLGQPGPTMISVLIERPTPLVRLEYLLRRLRDGWRQRR